MQVPRAPFGAGELGHHRPAYDFQPVAHARQEALGLVVAEVDPTGEEAADAGCRTPLSRDRSLWVVLVSRIAWRSTSPRLVMT